MRRQAAGHADTAHGPLGSSGSSLHAKTFAVDGQRVFVGSFNFDPRSARLNTELGFVIESPQLAQQVSTAFAQQIPLNSYRVLLDEQGRLEWRSGVGQPPAIYHQEPGTHWLERSWLRLLGWLPIEWLL
ncbi:cardiolipin synthetase [compost metagenome]